MVVASSAFTAATLCCLAFFANQAESLQDVRVGHRKEAIFPAKKSLRLDKDTSLSSDIAWRLS
jgi:hypothetical protein